jgi:hypothetical protein
VVKNTNALPRNPIIVPRAGIMTATAQRYRIPFSSVHSKEQADEFKMAQRHNTCFQRNEERKEN